MRACSVRLASCRQQHEAIAPNGAVLALSQAKTKNPESEAVRREREEEWR
jgi:hypothetical protein